MNKVKMEKIHQLYDICVTYERLLVSERSAAGSLAVSWGCGFHKGTHHVIS